MNDKRQNNGSEQPDGDKSIPNYKFYGEVQDAKASWVSAAATALGRYNTAKVGLLGSLATLGWIATQVIKNGSELTGAGLTSVIIVILLVGGVSFASLLMGGKGDGATQTTDTGTPPEP
jgi:hypothetical protein